MGGASSTPAGDSNRLDEEATSEFICPAASIPPGEAAGQPNKRRGSPPDDAGDKVARDGIDNGGVSSPIVLCDGRQLQRSNEETQSLLFSCHSTGAASGKVLDPSGSRQNVQQISSFKLDRAKHKIFLSHSGAQKGFVEQLCVDLEARGYFFPFFDQRQHSLPKGKDFVPLMKEAAQLCHVAIVVLSKEFLRSKWPMIELAEFHAAQQAGNQELNMLPLFYKLSTEDLDDRAIENCWMPAWIQHANDDKRIDVTKWSAAVRALRGANGLIFRKNAMSKVAYRKDIVQCISRLSPPDLLNDSSRDVVGYARMCQAVSSQFVKDNIRVGALVLGLYGMSGLGKSTLSKALCDYFYGEFSGRVCHVELGSASRMKQQKLMLKMICGFEKDVLDRITDVGQGLKQMRENMKREPVFLVIDNVTNDESSWKEAHAYLMVGFHPQSKIMITSRSKIILQDLLPDVRFCIPMPCLSEKEAGAMFLRSAAPMKSIALLTDEERKILRFCIEQCLFESDENELWFLRDDGEPYLRKKSYHPLALSALGDFFYRFISNNHMLLWRDHLKKNEDMLEDVWKSPSIMSIIGLQFNTLHPSEQLLFLDVALYDCVFSSSRFWPHLSQPDWVEWLSGLHEETPTVVERKLRDLERSGMIKRSERGAYSLRIITVHALYKEFAVWYVTEHVLKGWKNAWGVFQSSGASLRCDPPASKRWADLVRLRIFDLTRANARFVASKAMQELHNLVLLQLHSCTNLTVLNLQGLDCLRHLELVELTKLVTVTLTGSSSTDENVGIYDSLQNVLLKDLESLTYVPDFRSCTSLQSVEIGRCPKVTNFEGIECPHLKELNLCYLVPHQFGRIPNFTSLHSLVKLIIHAESDVDECIGLWWLVVVDFGQCEDFEASVGHREGPCFRFLEELVLHMREWNRLSAVYTHCYQLCK